MNPKQFVSVREEALAMEGQQNPKQAKDWCYSLVAGCTRAKRVSAASFIFPGFWRRVQCVQ
jgi:hypothetical protein